MVNTSLGTMLEPVFANRQNRDGQAFDLADEMSMITEIRIIDRNQLVGLSPFSDNGTCLFNGSTGLPASGF